MNLEGTKRAQGGHVEGKGQLLQRLIRQCVIAETTPTWRDFWKKIYI
ncbi:MAG: hypothetical protein A4E58_00279 [Syntrophorhabdus sp. PtaB.Bin006]|nr:MAG: hypothetical protein A4E58_00279 [Syntrophorhabdus sp. PtaB.Bin006]